MVSFGCFRFVLQKTKFILELWRKCWVNPVMDCLASKGTKEYSTRQKLEPAIAYYTLT